MKRLSVAAIALLAATALEGFAFVQAAQAFPAYFLTFRQTKLTFSGCAATAKQAVNTLGLANKVTDSFGAGGTVPAARGYILCIRLPKDGPCNKDGATVVFNSAGDSTAAAKSLLAKLDSTFGNPVLLDCN